MSMCGFCGLWLLDTGTTPILLGSVIIVNEAGLHRCTGGVAFRKVVNHRMLKIRISDLKSEGWNFTKFGKVQRNTPRCLAQFLKAVDRMTATVNPNTIVVGKGMDIIIKADLYRWTWGVAPCKVLNCNKLQLFGKSEQLKSIVLWGFWPNLVKTSEKGGRHRSTSASSPVMVLVGTLFLPIWQAGMLKMRVSALKSEGWNFLKFEKVKKTTPDALLSSQGRCAQDDCNCQPQYYWGWEGDGCLIM